MDSGMLRVLKISGCLSLMCWLRLPSELNYDKRTRRIWNSFHGCTCNGGQCQPLIFVLVSYAHSGSYCCRPGFLMLFSDLLLKIPKVCGVYPKARFFPLPVPWGGFQGLHLRGRAYRTPGNSRLIWWCLIFWEWFRLRSKG